MVAMVPVALLLSISDVVINNLLLHTRFSETL